MIRLLIVLSILALSGCATNPAYDGTNQEEIEKIKVSNNRWYWVTITAIAIVPY